MELNKRLDGIEQELKSLHEWRIKTEAEKSAKKSLYTILLRVAPWIFAGIAMVAEYKMLKR